jgi:23S rRNA pseudouridine2457 synthase
LFYIHVILVTLLSSIKYKKIYFLQNKKEPRFAAMQENNVSPNRYFLLNKPYNMVSQFVSSHKVPLLGEIDFDFPEGTHAIGRLDRTSEGLLILTTDKTVTRKLFLATEAHTRSYLVMVQHKMTEETFLQLQAGIHIPINDTEFYLAKPYAVKIITAPTVLYRYATDPREIYPHTWLLITLTEGKFRQVRKMVMAVKHRCLRLIRLNISNILLGNIEPGKIKELNEEIFYGLLAPSQKIPYN